ncbi:MAG TPA: hypothetical protein VJ757_03020 [Pseudonocardiaceae bacterium]|nr:hypothetical protein [Pseudonocardiaceae bacterium]
MAHGLLAGGIGRRRAPDEADQGGLGEGGAGNAAVGAVSGEQQRP